MSNETIKTPPAYCFIKREVQILWFAKKGSRIQFGFEQSGNCWWQRRFAQEGTQGPLLLVSAGEVPQGAQLALETHRTKCKKPPTARPATLADHPKADSMAVHTLARCAFI